MKKVYQNIKVHAEDLAAGKVRVQNKYFFTNLNEFEADVGASQATAAKCSRARWAAWTCRRKPAKT